MSNSLDLDQDPDQGFKLFAKINSLFPVISLIWMKNRVDSDQMASSEARRPGFTLFFKRAIEYSTASWHMYCHKFTLGLLFACMLLASFFCRVLTFF